MVRPSLGVKGFCTYDTPYGMSHIANDTLKMVLLHVATLLATLLTTLNAYILKLLY